MMETTGALHVTYLQMVALYVPRMVRSDHRVTFYEKWRTPHLGISSAPGRPQNYNAPVSHRPVSEICRVAIFMSVIEFDAVA